MTYLILGPATAAGLSDYEKLPPSMTGGRRESEHQLIDALNADMAEKVDSVIVDTGVSEIDCCVVCIKPYDGGNAAVLGNAPKIGMRKTIQPPMFVSKKEAGDIVFQNSIAAGCGLADAAAECLAVLIKIRVAADKQVGMSNIGEKMAFDARDDVICVAFQILRRQAIPAIVIALRDRGFINLIIMCS